MMLNDLITILKYEYTVHPGEYFNVDTYWVKSMSEVKTVIIDQDNVFTKMVSFYPKNFVIYLEQFPDQSSYRTNFPLKKIDNSDSHEVLFDETTKNIFEYLD